MRKDAHAGVYVCTQGTHTHTHTFNTYTVTHTHACRQLRCHTLSQINITVTNLLQRSNIFQLNLRVMQTTPPH